MKAKALILACTLAAAKELIDESHQSSALINTQLVETEFYDGE